MPQKGNDMSLTEMILTLYNKRSLDLPVAMAAAATNWFYGSHEAAVEAIEATGDGAIDVAMDAAEKEFGRGWRPLLLNTPNGVLSFIPVAFSAYEPTLERLRAKRPSLGVAGSRRKEQEMNNKPYIAEVETMNGIVIVSYDDDDINRLGGVAALLRELWRYGAYITPSEIAAAAYRCGEEAAA
jgi:hypothetical protein